MMALKLDAICAKLKLNITSTESGISSSENNNDSKSPKVISCHSLQLKIKDSDMKWDSAADDDKVSSLFNDKVVASSPVAVTLGSTKTDSDVMIVSTGGAGLSAAGRRNRRKNFQPRFIQEVCGEEIPEENVELTLSDDDKSSLDRNERSFGAVVVANDDLGVLDLRMGDISEAADVMNVKQSVDDEEELSVDNCGVIDLSLPRKTNENLPNRTFLHNTASKSRSEVKTSRDAVDDVLSNGGHQFSCLDKCSVDGLMINDFALQSMNKLLKIYGFSEESDLDSVVKRLPTTSSDALPWTSDLMKVISFLPESAVSNSPSVIPEVSRLSLPCDDLDLTKSSTSLSNESMETSTNASMNEDSSHPGLKQHAFLPNIDGFSGKFSLPKRSSLKEHCSTTDYGKYAKRFNSFEECSNTGCRERNFKEHFHCTACTSRVCLKKEEMIRHFKWHKKREDSLQHGFMRYSPMDDCSKKFSTHCSHNGKHTHYHCLQNGCSKVYISTSDVQMHANYHRKDSAIIQEGFQRFRATENCAMVSCAFAGQKTTHFHCHRPGCNFTFKNKADIEKHKTYHQKDEILARDGFKKFMKYEQCHFAGCHYSRVSNHIHCIRPDCNYVLHSTGQLYSHKRKHERRELDQSVYKQLGSSDGVHGGALSRSNGLSSALATVSQTAVMSTAVKQELGISEYFVNLSDSKSSDVAEPESPELTSNGLKMTKGFPEEKETLDQNHFLSTGLAKLASDLAGKDLGDSLNLPISFSPLPEVSGKRDDEETSEESSSAAKITSSSSAFFKPKTLPPVNEKKERDESWKRYLTRYTANDPCHAQCQFLYKDHYHCNQVDCGWLFRSKDGVREHAKFHEQQDRITALTFMKYGAETKCTEGCDYSEKLLHYHCLWLNCSHVISSKDSTFSRLEHHKLHDSFGRKTTQMNCGSSVDSLKRKRGRPPKFPKNDIPVIPKIEMTEEELLTQTAVTGLNSPIANGFKKYEDGQLCPDDQCIYAQTKHYHCVRPRCHHVTNRSDILTLHAKDFHSFIVIADGFEFFDRNVNCRRPHCHSNQSNRHFHCIRPNCDYSFVRYSTMVQHDRKHRAAGGFVDSSSTKPASKVKTNLSSSLSSNSASASNAMATVAMAPNAMATIAMASNAMASGQGSVSDAHSNATLHPVSCVVSSAEAPVVLSPTSFGLTPLVLTSLQSLPALSRQTVTPIVVGSIKQGLQGHDLQLTSSPLKLVSIAPKPSAIVAFQAPISSAGVEIATPQVSGTVASGTKEAPLTLLLQQKTCTMPTTIDWFSMKLKMHHKVHQNCGRPFCKLKKKDHYHCFDCNQAFSDPIRLKSHVARHGVSLESARMVRDDHHVPNREPKTVQKQEENATLDETEMTLNVEDDEEIETDPSRQDVQCSEEMPEGDFTERSELLVPNNLEECSEFDDADSERLVIDLSSVRSCSDGTSVQRSDNTSVASGVSLDPSLLLNGNSTKFCQKREFEEGLSDSNEQKKPKVATRDYEKFRFNEDCGKERCAYRLSMTHYHCSRLDCGYSFCDHSRFLQHSDRHQRIDVVMGDQFRHFHAKTDCQHVGCEHARTATHFHCLICSYVCTDSSKVVAHRKHHSKMDRVTENGFQRFGIGEDCEYAACAHRLKQTHYHCSHANCGHVVMGPAQMGLHKAKHVNNVNSLTNFME